MIALELHFDDCEIAKLQMQRTTQIMCCMWQMQQMRTPNGDYRVRDAKTEKVRHSEKSQENIQTLTRKSFKKHKNKSKKIRFQYIS